MPFEAYLKKGLLKRQRIDFRQIEKQIVRAKKDLDTARMLLAKDSEWAATIAYQAMLRTGRALLFSSGYLPADGGQHRTVVELTHQLLGKNYAVLVERFEKMRRKRNTFFYESDPFGTLTEAESALKAAPQLAGVIQGMIQKENPQIHFSFD
jgi:uncharacterized protein (UPF0332 family)